jgi:Tol biopolymer transport system component
VKAQPERDFVLPAVDPRTFDAGENCDLYLIRSDGSQIVNLTDTQLDSENRAVWSADGRRLYFSRNSVGWYSGYAEMQSSTSFYVMDVSEDGENLGERLLFRMSDVFERPLRVEEWVLSPDEQTIAFQPYDYISPDGETFDWDVITLYSVGIDGSNLRQLIVGESMQVHGETALWSPDGDEIAFSSRACEGGLCRDEYFVIRPRSLSQSEHIGEVRDLLRRWHPEMEAVLTDETTTVYAAQSLWPVLSPEKSAVVYSDYDFEERTSTLMLAPVDEPSETTGLTPAFEDDIWYPRWSPDGTQIAFLLRDGGSLNVSLYRVDADGGDLTELHYARLLDFAPVEWRPDVL